MNKIYTLLLLNFFVTFSYCQMQTGGSPFTMTSASEGLIKSIDPVQFPELDMTRIDLEDANAKAEGKLELYSRFHHTNLNTNNAGSWTELPNGDKLWRLKINAKNAEAIHIVYSDFYLPKGTILYIYSEDYSDIIGGFTSENNKPNRSFASGNIDGETCVLEYYEPANTKEEVSIAIDKIGHAYRWAKKLNPEQKADPCEVDVACDPENADWKNQIKGVVRISVQSSDGAGWCSGTVINNTSLDCKPYVLTALHCGVSSTTNDFNGYVFYFNYQRANCGSGSAPTNQSRVGCTKIASSNDGGGNSGPDYLLVEITTPIPASYNVFYNGWNAGSSASPSGVSIHHPAGSEKKISTYTTSLSTTSWGSSSTHWSVRWRATPNGHGVTEGGSSGSPIFDNNGRVVGQLTGGGSFCTNTNATDSYGKMSVNWTQSNSTPRNPGDALRDYLDPTNSGVLTMEGTFVPCAPPTYNNMAAENVFQPTTDYCTNTFTPSIQVKNYGLDNLTTAIITYNVDGGSDMTFNWSGVICPNDVETVNLPDVTTTDGSHTFNVTITTVNGTTDGDVSNNTTSSSFSTATELGLTFSTVHPTCGASDGSITPNITGGTSGFTYDWSNSETTAAIFGLGIGAYTLDILDSRNCAISATENLSNPGAPTVTASDTDETCQGECDGEVTSSATGGTGTIVYSWDGGLGTGQNQSNVCPGTYMVTATDDLGCVSFETVTVSNGGAFPNAAFNAIPGTNVNTGDNVTFLNISSGGATAYSWDFGDGATSTSANGTHSYTSGGTYTVTLSATKNGCTDVETIIMTVAGPASIEDQLTDVHINIHPNPTNGIVNIGLSGAMINVVTLKLHTMDGKLVYTKSNLVSNANHIMDMSSVEKGMYMLTISNGAEKSVKRIILQ